MHFYNDFVLNSVEPLHNGVHLDRKKWPLKRGLNKSQSMGCLRCRRSKPSVYYIKTSEWAECKAGYEWTVRQK